MLYIDINFTLNYKLIGFEELDESHIGLYIYTEFINLLNSYLSFKNENNKNILSITWDNTINNVTFINTYKNKALYKGYDI